MYYFTYKDGKFYVNYEFIDSYASEIVDIVYCYDYLKINKWCEFANLDFPFELNILYPQLFFKDYFSSEKFVKSFCELVNDFEIEIYCKELKK